MNDTPQPETKPKKGLTYGRLMLIMLAIILVVVGWAFVRQWLVTPAPTFGDVTFEAVRDADYDLTEVNATALSQASSLTASLGTLLFVKTVEGNVAKLSAEFGFCLIDPVNPKFWIRQGTVYNPLGDVVQQLGNACVDLNQRFDLESGLAEGQGAPAGSADLDFSSQGPALHMVIAISPAALSLPGVAEIAGEPL